MMILPTSARICLCAARKDSSMATSDSAAAAVMIGSIVKREPRTALEARGRLPGGQIDTSAHLLRSNRCASGPLAQMRVLSLYQCTRQVLMINERFLFFLAQARL